MPASIFQASAVTRTRVKAGWAAGLLVLAIGASTAAFGQWRPLADDGVHDPDSPAMGQLQEPSEALSKLPADTAGNMVNWIQALETGAITPRTNILPETKVQVLDLDVLMNLRGSQDIVRFPHRAHTLWLDCSNCHEQLFKAKAGANKLSMFKILEGEQCGLCHGAVAFPLTECSRCHNVSRSKPAAASVPTVGGKAKP